MGLGVAAGTMIAPALARRVSQPAAISGGLAVSALGGLLLAGARGARALPLVLAGIAVLAAGTGPLFALGTGARRAGGVHRQPARDRRRRRGHLRPAGRHDTGPAPGRQDRTDRTGASI
jgi:hypothetical protein